jgi:hypothetical protein
VVSHQEIITKFSRKHKYSSRTVYCHSGYLDELYCRLSRMSRYFTAFILPSTLHKVPTPYYVMHPQIITDTFLGCGDMLFVRKWWSERSTKRNDFLGVWNDGDGLSIYTGIK